MPHVRAHRFLALCSTIILVASCASGGGQAGADRSERCALQPGDSVFAARGTVYRDCAVDREARLVGKRIEPDFKERDRRACYHARIEFVVGTDGVPEMETLRT